MKEAGYPKGITLNMCCESVLNELLVGEAMVPQLAEAGITINFEQLAPGVAFEDLLSPHPKHQLFILVYGWVNGPPSTSTPGRPWPTRSTRGQPSLSSCTSATRRLTAPPASAT